MLVEEVMTKKVVSINSDRSVFDASKDYFKHRVGSLVVMDNNIIFGIITERDIIEKVILQNRDPKNTKIREIMTSNIKTVHALAPLEKAAKIMKDNNIKKLPVILNNEIVGIVTETDLTHTIEAFSEAVEELARFYNDSRENIEKMLDEWGNILVGLKGFKKLTESRELNLLKEV